MSRAGRHTELLDYLASPLCDIFDNPLATLYFGEVQKVCLQMLTVVHNHCVGIFDLGSWIQDTLNSSSQVTETQEIDPRDRSEQNFVLNLPSTVTLDSYIQANSSGGAGPTVSGGLKLGYS